MGTLEKPITTQEELDAVIGDRLKRDREVQAKKYEGFISPDAFAQAKGTYETQAKDLATQLEGFKAQLAEKDKAIKQYEAASVKSRIADEIGLDRRLLNRLGGETEEEIRKDAQALKALFDQAAPVAPLASTEQPAGDAATAALKTMLNSMKKGD